MDLSRIFSEVRLMVLGKPEPLKENLSGMWSRRIDDTNRIVYYEKDEIIYIVSCKGHYDD